MKCKLAAAFRSFPMGNSNFPHVAAAEKSQDEPAEVEQLASLSGKGHVEVFQDTTVWCSFASS